MKITKYEHACIALEEQGQRLVIDPGAFTTEFGGTQNIAVVVITHLHPDHLNPEHIAAIVAANPNVQIFTPADAASGLKSDHVTIVSPGMQQTVGPFALQFYGEQHELIHDKLPRPQNTAVFVNDVFFYPGDSYTNPGRPVKLLAVPACAPWMKIADSIDYLASLRPELCIPTHNGMLNDNGHKVYNGGLTFGAEQAGSQFTYLQPGESLEV